MEIFIKAINQKENLKPEKGKQKKKPAHFQNTYCTSMKKIGSNITQGQLQIYLV